MAQMILPSNFLRKIKALRRSVSSSNPMVFVLDGHESCSVEDDLRMGLPELIVSATKQRFNMI